MLRIIFHYILSSRPERNTGSPVSKIINKIFSLELLLKEKRDLGKFPFTIKRGW